LNLLYHLHLHCSLVTVGYMALKELRKRTRKKNASIEEKKSKQNAEVTEEVLQMVELINPIEVFLVVLAVIRIVNALKKRKKVLKCRNVNF